MGDARRTLERFVPVAVTDADRGDLDLLERVAAGDEEAFRALFRRYSGTALSLARRIVREAALAEEVVQEAFLALWQTADRFDGRRGSFRAWLMGMVHHRAVDAVRREQTQRNRTQEIRAVVIVDDPAVEVVDRIDAPADAKAVRMALDGLPSEQREVLELMYFEGLSQSRIAERLGVPLGTVKSRTLFGMRKLRSALIVRRA